MTQDIWIKKKYAVVKEIKGCDPIINGLRVYCTQFPDNWYFQIHAHGSTNPLGGGKERDMIAGLTLTIEEVEEILRQMKEYANT